MSEGLLSVDTSPANGDVNKDPVTPKAAFELGNFTCVSCCDEFSKSDPHFHCPNDMAYSHPQCLPCFNMYVNHCCDQAAVEDTVPLKCPIPACKTLVPPHIASMLIHQIDLTITNWSVERESQTPQLNELLFQKYDRVQIQTALRSVVQGHEKLWTCQVCGVYSVLYQQEHTPDYWILIERKKETVMNTVDARVDKHFQGLKAQFLKERGETLKKIRVELEAAAAEHKAMNKEQLIQINKECRKNAKEKLEEMRKLEEEKREVRLLTRAEKLKLLTIKMTPEPFRSREQKQILFFLTNPKTPGRSEAEWDAEFETLMAESRKTMMPESALATKEKIDTLKNMYAEEQKKTWKDDPVIVQSLKEALKAKIASCATVKELEWTQKGMEADPATVLEEKYEVDEKEEEMNETTKFVACQRHPCPGAMCTMCERILNRSEISGHTCQFNEVGQLYQIVLRELAQASTRTCPMCGFIGQKDLACTHITCTKCQKRWCYLCQKPEGEMVGGFSQHNQWNLNTPEGSGHCPTYLQWKYGNHKDEVNNRMDGEPGPALEAYHLVLQKKAISEVKSKSDPQVWNQMLKFNFPDGLLEFKADDM
jgi:hypothetical protein